MVTATALIVINQLGKPPGVPGRSRDDLARAIPGQPVVLTNNDNTGATSWNWRMLSRPPGSLAGFSAPTASSVSFVPDLVGSYLIQLLVNGRARATIVAAVKTSFLGLRIPAKGETTEFDGWEEALQEIFAVMEAGIQAGGDSGLTKFTQLVDGPGAILNGYVPVGVVPGAGSPFLDNRLFAFTSLGDCPSTFSGQGGKFVKVSPGENSLVFGAGGGVGAFTDLSDVPSSYSGQGNKSVRVNAGENGLEFQTPVTAFVNLSDVPGSYGSQALKHVRVNASETGLEFAAAGSGASDRTLLFADDTQFDEGGTTLVTKKTFRVVSDSGKPFSSFRVVVGIWHDTATSADCDVFVGSDHLASPLSTTSTSEAVNAGTIAFTGSDNTFLTVEVQLRRTGGTGDAHIKFTEIYGIYA
jgi:hypothetical protein